jgi:hypothetical protein
LFTTTYELDVFTGTEEKLPEQNKLAVYPNPVKNLLTITADHTQGKTVDLIITDLSGKIMLQKSIQNSSPLKEFVDVSDFSRGLYLLRLDFGTYQEQKKFMVH